MEVIEKTQQKVVVRHRRHEILRAVLFCLLFALLFYLLDAKHPKSSLFCTRHAVLPDNELEAIEGLHVEDIDCSLTVRPTRTALDLTFFEEISYSFEIDGAHLSRPPERPPEPCLKHCSRQGCSCRGTRSEPEGPILSPSTRRFLEYPSGLEQADYDEATGDGNDAAEDAAMLPAAGDADAVNGRPHHSFHLGVNDVATLVLRDNQGNTYDFYTFQDEDVAEHMLKRVQDFIREARGGASPSSVKAPEGDEGAKAEQDPLQLEVLYDDSWLDEMACALFLVCALVLMSRPYAELVEFDAESGAMALDRWNLFQCGVFRYSCALENVSKLEITEADVWILSAHAFEHLRQGKEFGLRMVFSLPPGGAGVRASSPPMANASVSSSSTPSVAGPGGGPLQAANAPLHPMLSRIRGSRHSVAGMLHRCFRGLVGFARPRPITRCARNAGGYMHLELGFGAKAHDDRKLRRPVELVNDLLLRFSSDVEGVGAHKGGRGSDGSCCVCYRRRARVVTFPCMHMAVCPQCSGSLSACPLCRTAIAERHTVFL